MVSSVGERLKAFARRLRDDYWYPFALGLVLIVVGSAVASLNPRGWPEWTVFVVCAWLIGGVILFVFRTERHRKR